MAAYRKLVRQQWESSEVLQASCQIKVAAMLRHAASQVPYYRKYCRENGLAPETLTFADLARFPLVDKKIILAQANNFLDPGVAAEDLVPNFTGGSSGTPFKFFSDRRSMEARKGNDMRMRAWSGWSPGEKQAVIWAHPGDIEKGASLRDRFMSTFVHRSRLLDAYNMDPARIDEFYRDLVRFRPVMIRGYASSLVFFAEYLQENNRPPLPLKGIISSAETLTDKQRGILEGYFHCRVYNRYGSREFGVIAQQCQQSSGLHVVNDRLYLEILDPEGIPCGPGESGEITITDLENRAMPFIRYRTGDIAAWSSEPCSCGRGFPLLQSVSGRTSELLVGKNGRYYSCLGPRFFGHDLPDIVQMQVIQESLDKVVVKVVPGPDWAPEGGRVLSHRLVSLLGDIDVDILEVDSIPPSPSGKYHFAVSKVSPFS